MLTCFDVSRRLYSKSYLRMKCLSFPCASWAASVSIFYEPQPNHCVRIISHQLGYTTAENIFWRRLISEEGALEESGGLPQRSENSSLRYSEESNFAVTLCSIYSQMIYCPRYQTAFLIVMWRSALLMWP